MSKKNTRVNNDGYDVAAPMSASAAVAEPEQAEHGEQAQHGERETSFTQSSDIDDDNGADAPPVNILHDENVKAMKSQDDINKAAKCAAFREYCKQYPDTIHNFELSSIIADPKRNVRFVERTVKDAAVQDLAAAIKSAGRQIVPGEVLLGLDDNLYVNDGAGRYLALTLINSTRQPSDQLSFRAVVILETVDAPMQSLIDQAQINWHREGLTVLDRAKIVGELKAGGMKQADIARKLGIKPVMCSVLVKVGGFTDNVKNWIVEDKISASAAYDLAVLDPEKVEGAAQKLIDGAGGKKVNRTMVNVVAQKVKEKKAKAGTATTKAAKRTKQRSIPQILSFIEDEATPATDKKFGDKNLSKKLQCFASLVSGVGGDTFLKNLSAL